MRFSDWLSPQWVESLIRWLSFGGFSILSPFQWSIEQALSPYLSPQDLKHLVSLSERLGTLPPEILQDQLLPKLAVCLCLNVSYILLCRKASELIVKNVRQGLQPNE